ncbi:MAG: N-6 DNA methylase [Blastocatellia bacterium]
MLKIDEYKVPTEWHAREALREKGQFWTPDWIAEVMVEYVLTGGSEQVFDPAVGAGAFFRAAKTVAREKRTEIALAGMDIDRAAIEQARQFGISAHDLANVRISDFIFDPPKHKLKSIVANPPYICHHRLSPEIKEKLKQ